ncbi:type IIA topoisomerase (DNA gyrase/topo II, topoisomerase IV), B subunit [Candidatus Scalindua japonica]|uniref:Type IIA topoisomerase (DNA gyrase/topo II, topoisomerase IV), B subunit n=1 Tax=Candidatus Scalindua japonica TaxID=1284222 RepID=A0A286U107_9BACT|nr:type IIA topoisomerase (DNA gyrase/topo II, topoisomerase IV), B subunit [Candidatus Scalindua japonica]
MIIELIKFLHGLGSKFENTMGTNLKPRLYKNLTSFFTFLPFLTGSLQDWQGEAMFIRLKESLENQFC